MREEVHLLSGKNKWTSFLVNKACLKIIIFFFEGFFISASLYIIDSYKGGDALEESDILNTARREEYFVKILNKYEKLVFSVCSA